jgi:hypothetical protein
MTLCDSGISHEHLAHLSAWSRALHGKGLHRTISSSLFFFRKTYSFAGKHFLKIIITTVTEVEKAMMMF